MIKNKKHINPSDYIKKYRTGGLVPLFQYGNEVDPYGGLGPNIQRPPKNLNIIQPYGNALNDTSQMDPGMYDPNQNIYIQDWESDPNVQLYDESLDTEDIENTESTEDISSNENITDDGIILDEGELQCQICDAGFPRNVEPVNGVCPEGSTVYDGKTNPCDAEETNEEVESEENTDITKKIPGPPGWHTPDPYDIGPYGEAGDLFHLAGTIHGMGTDLGLWDPGFRGRGSDTMTIPAEQQTEEQTEEQTDELVCQICDNGTPRNVLPVEGKCPEGSTPDDGTNPCDKSESTDSETDTNKEKDTDEEISFDEAFAAARTAGKETFEWNGKTYNTKTREEVDAEKDQKTLDALKEGIKPPQSQSEIDIQNERDKILSGNDQWWNNDTDGDGIPDTIDAANEYIWQQMYGGSTPYLQRGGPPEPSKAANYFKQGFNYVKDKTKKHVIDPVVDEYNKAVDLEGWIKGEQGKFPDFYGESTYDTVERAEKFGDKLSKTPGHLGKFGNIIEAGSQALQANEHRNRGETEIAKDMAKDARNSALNMFKPPGTDALIEANEKYGVTDYIAGVLPSGNQNIRNKQIAEKQGGGTTDESDYDQQQRLFNFGQQQDNLNFQGPNTNYLASMNANPNSTNQPMIGPQLPNLDPDGDGLPTGIDATPEGTDPNFIGPQPQPTPDLDPDNDNLNIGIDATPFGDDGPNFNPPENEDNNQDEETEEDGDIACQKCEGGYPVNVAPVDGQCPEGSSPDDGSDPCAGETPPKDETQEETEEEEAEEEKEKRPFKPFRAAIKAAEFVNAWSRRREDRKKRKAMVRKTSADGVFGDQAQRADNRGQYDTNTGMQKPDKQVYARQGKYGTELIKAQEGGTPWWDQAANYTKSKIDQAKKWAKDEVINPVKDELNEAVDIKGYMKGEQGMIPDFYGQSTSNLTEDMREGLDNYAERDPGSPIAKLASYTSNNILGTAQAAHKLSQIDYKNQPAEETFSQVGDIGKEAFSDYLKTGEKLFTPPPVKIADTFAKRVESNRPIADASVSQLQKAYGGEELDLDPKTIRKLIALGADIEII